MSKELNSYYAGFFDGEGSIGIYRNGRGAWHLRTQLTQNINKASASLLDEMQALFGGNLSLMRGERYRGGRAYNWQLNGETAVRFLQDVLPYLRLKREQAFFAIRWHRIAQKQSRGPDGRMVRHDYQRPVDIWAAKLLKALKKSDLDSVVEQDAMLAQVVGQLNGVAAEITA